MEGLEAVSRGCCRENRSRNLTRNDEQEGERISNQTFCPFFQSRDMVLSLFPHRERFANRQQHKNHIEISRRENRTKSLFGLEQQELQITK